MMKRMGLAVLAAALASGAARAEVTDSTPQGFEVRETATIAARPEKVWFTLEHPSRWWDPKHTYSHDARNLSFDATGCFCELLPHGAVRHMMLVYADGASEMRLAGALGPLQLTGSTGALVIRLKPSAAGTEVTMSYDVGGYVRGGLAETFAAPMDRVLGEQLGRLKKAVETGKPE